MATKAHEAFSLAVSFLNTSLDAQFLPLQDASSKNFGAYLRGLFPFFDRIISTSMRLRDLYASKVLEALASVIPSLYLSIPLLLLSVPVRYSPGKRSISLTCCGDQEC